MLKNNIINKLFTSYRLFFTLLVMIISFIGTKIILVGKSDLDFNFVFSLLCIGVIIAIKVYELSLKNPVLIYIPLQLILVTIFIDTKIAKITSVELKLYGLIFILATLIAITYLFKYFSWLWKNFILFRSFFIFFLINAIFYFTFYHSSFREWSAYYFTNMQFLNIDSKILSIQASGLYPTNSFNETKQIGMYLGSIVPLVASTISLMAFQGLYTIESINNRVAEIIKYIVSILSIYIVLSLLTIPLGLSTFMFIFDGRLWSDFLGIAGFSEYYLSIFIILLVGFKYYINNNQFEQKHLYNSLINFSALAFFTILCLFIVKATLIALTFSLAIMLWFNYRNKFKIGMSKPLIFIIGFLLIILISTFSAEISVFVDKMIMRFSNSHSLQMRADLWSVYVENWINNLNIFNFIFGHGIDTSRELAFNVAFMEPSYGVLGVPHVHNAYLEIFYDYGMMGLLYIGTLFYIWINNLKIILSKNIENKNLKLISAISFTIILYTSIYYTAEVFRIPASIVLFSSLGMLEALKYIYINKEER